MTTEDPATTIALRRSRVRRLAAAAGAIVRSIRTLLFGYDVFVSYAHGARSTPYVRRLESTLRDMDYAVFRDESSLMAGDELSLAIRLALRRTRTLVVVLSDEAPDSTWVHDEIVAFSSRRRPICVLDIEAVRRRSRLGPLEPLLADRLMIEDEPSGPHPPALIALTEASAGRRANHRARLTIVGVAATVLLLSLASAWLGRSLVRRSQDLVASATLAMAESHHDPLVQTLLLAELDLDRAPARAADLARTVGTRDVPRAVLRRVPADYDAMTFVPDSHDLVTFAMTTVDDVFGVSVSRVFMDQSRDPELLRRLPDWTIDTVGPLADGDGVILIDGARAAIIPIDGPTTIVHAPTQAAIDAWWLAHATSAPREIQAIELEGRPVSGIVASEYVWDVERQWAIGPRGAEALFATDVGIVLLDATRDTIRFTDDLDGRTVVAMRLHGPSPDLPHATVLCDDGTVFRLSRHGDAWRLAIESGMRLVPAQVVAYGAIDARGRVAGVIGHAEEQLGYEAHAFDGTVHTGVGDGSNAITSWTVAQQGHRALIRFEDETVGLLDLSTGVFAAQPGATRTRVLSAAALFEGIDVSDTSPLVVETEEASMDPTGRAIVLPGVRSSALWTADATPGLRWLASNDLTDTSCRAAFSDDGAFVATSDVGSIRIWSLTAPMYEPRSVKLPGRGGRLALHGDDVTVACDNGSVASIDVTTPDSLLRTIVAPASVDGSGMLESDGRFILHYVATASTGVDAIAGDADDAPDQETDAPVLGFDASSVTVEVADGDLPDLPDLEIDEAIETGRLEVRDRSGAVRATRELLGSLRVYADAQLSATYACYLDPTDPTRIVRWNFVDDTSDQITAPSQILAWRLLPESNDVITFDADGTLRRSGRAPTILGSVPGTEGQTVWDDASNPEGTRILIGVGTRLVGWDHVDGMWVHEIEFEDDEFWSPVIIGDRFVVGTETGRLGVGSFAARGVQRWLTTPTLTVPETERTEGPVAHLGPIFAVLAGPDGLILSAGAMDSSVKVWHLQRGFIGRIPMRTIPRDMLMLPDGRLLTTSEEGVLQVWTLQAEALIERLAARTSGVLAPAERVRYLGEPHDVARRRYEAAERDAGRTPLDPRFLLDVDFEF